MGVAIAIPLALYAICSNHLWAEPEPPKQESVFTVEKYAEPEEVEVVVEVMEQEETEMDELELLACLVESEAGNQSELGKRLVVDVVLNRIDSPDFANNITDVIMQVNQFAVVSNGTINSVVPTQETWEAVYKELNSRIDSEILYFQTDDYSQYGQAAFRVDDHYFSTGGGL